jgi:hypothetical protein
MNTHSQNAAILQALRRGDSITALEAIERFGSARLAARIADIRAMGHDVKTAWEKQGGKRFARYYLNTPRLSIIEAIPAFPPAETKPTNQLF